MDKKAFEVVGTVAAVLIADDPRSLRSRVVQKMSVVRGYGIKGDRHAGARLADVREKEFLTFGLPKGMEIANHREFSAVSDSELCDISHAMHVPKDIPYGCLGENLVISGIRDFTQLPSGSLLFFRKDAKSSPRTAVLAVWSENLPCVNPGEVIQESFPEIKGLTRLFPKAAIGRRGVIGSIFASGVIHEGDQVVIKIPRQRLYTGT